ncbi:hypothetical protein ACLMJK_002192 [Lecanora helva]
MDQFQEDPGVAGQASSVKTDTVANLVEQPHLTDIHSPSSAFDLNFLEFDLPTEGGIQLGIIDSPGPVPPTFQPFSGNLSAIEIRSIVPGAKMAKPRAQRAEKRHLIRWTDEMDKRLLLTIQSECNLRNIPIPWEDVGKAMGEHVTGGAVIQHLAKVRLRMIDQGLAVPAALKRGGALRISTGSSSSRVPRPTKASTGNGRGTLKKNPGKTPTKRHASTGSEDTVDEDFDAGSDSDYGKPTAKRAKTAGRKRESPKTKAEDDDLGDIEDGRDDDDDVAVVKSEDDEDGRILAAGASFLALQNKSPKKGKVSKKTLPGANAKKSLIVSLQIPKANHAHVKKESPQKDSDSGEEDLPAEAAARTLATMQGEGKGIQSAKLKSSSQSAPAHYVNQPSFGTLAPYALTSHVLTADESSANGNSTASPGLAGLPSSATSFLGNYSFSPVNGTSYFENEYQEPMGTSPHNMMMYGNAYDSGFEDGVGILQSTHESMSSFDFEHGMYSNLPNFDFGHQGGFDF